jgi:ubiquinone/menaquinone biosynthesis C-methylase UbiE
MAMAKNARSMLDMLKPDYPAHDEVYRSIRARGLDGWSVASEYTKMMRWLEPSLSGAQHGPGHLLAQTFAARSLLEIGCGAGNLSIMLARLGHRVTGVDVAPSAIDWAKERAATESKPPTFMIGNALDLRAQADASFEGVVDGHCLHCIVGTEDRRSCLEAIHRVLKPGGSLYVMSMCGPVLNDERLRHFDASTMTFYQSMRPVRHIGSASSVLDELRRAGFDIATAEVTLRADANEQDDLYAVAVSRR